MGTGRTADGGAAIWRTKEKAVVTAKNSEADGEATVVAATEDETTEGATAKGVASEGRDTGVDRAGTTTQSFFAVLPYPPLV